MNYILLIIVMSMSTGMSETTVVEQIGFRTLRNCISAKAKVESDERVTAYCLDNMSIM